MKEIYHGVYAVDSVDEGAVSGAIFGCIDDIMVTDGEGRVLAASRNAENNLEVPLEEIVGRRAGDLVGKGVYNRSTIVECLRERKTQSGLLRTKRGEFFFSTSTPYLAPDGQVSYTVTYTRDYGLLDAFKCSLAEMESSNQKIGKLVSYLQEEGQERSVIAASERMKRICEMCRELSDSDSTVLITGETGTGKEVMAKYLYHYSQRRDRLFVPVNCGSIPENLIESELFGYEKGAFTGANAKGHTGLIEVASGGTLFLDEIGEVPKALQPKLLRFLEEGEIRRVGSSQNIKVDVRVICATNRDLYQMVRNGSFREDLYYRLNVIPVKLPPLRERKEDIVPLAQHFVNTYNQKYKKQVTLSQRQLDQFLQYGWPGNIRELRNVVERMVVTDGFERPMPEILPSAGAEDRQRTSAGEGQQPVSSLKAARAAFETRYIQQAIQHCNGNVTMAARLLEVDRTLIYKKLRAAEAGAAGEEI